MLRCDEPSLPNFAFQFNLRPYTLSALMFAKEWHDTKAAGKELDLDYEQGTVLMAGPHATCPLLFSKLI
jgi:hypothetical protein